MTVVSKRLPKLAIGILTQLLRDTAISITVMRNPAEPRTLLAGRMIFLPLLVEVGSCRQSFLSWREPDRDKMMAVLSKMVPTPSTAAPSLPAS